MKNKLKIKSKTKQIICSLIMLALIPGLALPVFALPTKEQTKKINIKDKENTKETTIEKDSKVSDNIEIKPEIKSAGWYYERALVFYLREQTGRATIELYKALEKSPDDAKVNYLLGQLFKERRLWKEASDAFFKVTQTTKVEHIPARLELAFASVQLTNYQVTFLQLEKVLQLMKLDKTYRSRLQQYQIDASTEKDSSNLKKKLKIDVKTEIENFIIELFLLLSDTPDSYNTLTVATGLEDPLIYNEIMELYDDEEEENNEKTLEVLKNFLEKQKGFSPLILAQIGAIYQKQSQNIEAIKLYEKVVNQLTYLGFSEAAGDFSTEEIKNLQTLKNSTPSQPANKRTVKDSPNKIVPKK